MFVQTPSPTALRSPLSPKGARENVFLVWFLPNPVDAYCPLPTAFSAPSPKNFRASSAALLPVRMQSEMPIPE